jgi:ribosomal protein S8
MLVLNIIRVGFTNNKKFVFAPNTVKSISVLRSLMSTGLIIGYSNIKLHESDRVILRIMLNKSVDKINITNLSTPTNQRTIRFKEIKKLRNISTASTYILITSYGIVNLQRAAELKTGGIMLAKIY